MPVVLFCFIMQQCATQHFKMCLLLHNMHHNQALEDPNGCLWINVCNVWVDGKYRETD